MRLLHAIVLGASLITFSTRAQPAPVTVEFPLAGLPLLPFGGETLLATTAAGNITDTHVHITFSTSEAFQSQHFNFIFGGPTGGLGFAGPDFGWTGQGAFTADFHSAALNGELLMQGRGPTLSFWFLDIHQSPESLPVPLTGSLDEPSFIRFTVQPCLVDWDGGFTLGVGDIFAFLTDFFSNNPRADIDGSGAPGVGDIFQFLALYFSGCDAF